MFSSFQYKNGCLAASDLFHMLKNVIHQIDSKNEWLLLSVSFTAKFGLIFVLTLENAFSLRFHFKAIRKSTCSFKNGNRDFQNSPPFKRSACFYVTISGYFERCQHFKVGLSPSKKIFFICFNESLLKVM